LRVAGLLAGLAGLAQAAPFVPGGDGQVLERLPYAADPLARESRRLRQDLRLAPGNRALAVKLAEHYIKLGKAEADPRYYGHAQGVLEPWWAMAAPPVDILLPRALILQNRHDFDGALRDLDALLRLEPGNTQAWLARAVVLQVRGRYEEARQSCLPLTEMDDVLVPITCLSSVVSLMGQASRSYELLAGALAEAPGASAEQRLWGYTVLAEIAARTGKSAEAERHFRQALAANGKDAYLLAAYADFLLDQDRPGDVLALLGDMTRVDGLLLRLALAQKQLGADGLADSVAKLQARFDAARLRGESLHQGDEARFRLFLLGQAGPALKLAQANWQAQREPKDARILLEAAIAAHDAQAARPVLEMLGRTGMEHAPLKRLAARLGDGDMR
jgi:hypothetical protein